MKPCDCKDDLSARKLWTQGIKHNDSSISIGRGRVRLEIGPTRVYLTRTAFKLMAEWFLEDQDED